MTVATTSNLSRHRGLLRWALAALIVAGIGAVTFHGFGWQAWGFAESGSPARVLVSYFQNGVAMIVLGIMACWVASMPIMWVVALTTGVRRAYRSVDKWCRRVRLEGLNPSVAVALPWLAATGLIATWIAVTGGIQSVSFWFAALFRLGITALITLYVAAWTIGILGLLTEPAARRLRPMIGALRSEVRERINVVFRVAVAVGIAGAIYSGIGIQLDAPPNLRLPVGDPVLGSFAVFVAVAVVAVGLSVPIKRFRRVHLFAETSGPSSSGLPVVTPRALPDPPPPPLPPPPPPAPVKSTAVTFAPVPATRTPPAPVARRRFPPVPWDVREPEEEFWSPTPVAGWRIWGWNGQYLKGVWEFWSQAEHTARCSSCQDVPGWSHTCGIYAVIDRADLRLFGPGSAAVVGKVELSGLVIEHDRGYRATHARITELWVPQSISVTDAISWRYPDVIVHQSPPWNEGSLD